VLDEMNQQLPMAHEILKGMAVEAVEAVLFDLPQARCHLHCDGLH